MALAEVCDAIAETSREFELPPSVTEAVAAKLQMRREAGGAELDRQVSEQDQIVIGLIALTNRERRLILDHHALNSVSTAAIERLLRNPDTILDATKAEGRAGYDRAAAQLLA